VAAVLIVVIVPLATLHARTTTHSSDVAKRGKTMLVLLSMLNIGLCTMMAALGVLTLISVHRNGNAIDNLSEPFLAAYMVMFAILLFVYELMWWRAMPGLNKSLRKNFGFLYGLRGKGFYLIFVAFLCLGLGKEASVATLNWATGIAYMAVGCFHIFLVCANPLMSAEYIAASPTAGLMSNDNAV
jgi:hypothetical protein